MNQVWQIKLHAYHNRSSYLLLIHMVVVHMQIILTALIFLQVVNYLKEIELIALIYIANKLI